MAQPSSQQGTSNDFYARTDDETKLEDIDPIFKLPTNTAGAVIATTSAPAPSTGITSEEATIGGAALGFASGRIPVRNISSPSVTNAKANVAAAQSNVKALTDAAQRAQTSSAGSVDTVFNRLQDAQAQYSFAQTELEAARQMATRSGIPLNVPSLQPGELLPGDKWAGKVTGSMGPGGDAVTEAARNYRLQQSLSPEEAAKFKVSRSALIVPNQVGDVGPYYNPQQRTQQQLLVQAQAAFDAAQKDLNSAQRAYDKLYSAGKPGNSANQLAAAERKAAAAAARLDSLEASSSSTTSKIGKVISKIPFINTASGALAGYEAQQALESFRKGDYFDAGMSAMGAAGGALSMAPNLPAKVVGAALSVPPLAYEAYKYFKKPAEESTQKP